MLRPLHSHKCNFQSQKAISGQCGPVRASAGKSAIFLVGKSVADPFMATVSNADTIPSSAGIISLLLHINDFSNLFFLRNGRWCTAIIGLKWCVLGLKRYIRKVRCSSDRYFAKSLPRGVAYSLVFCRVFDIYNGSLRYLQYTTAHNLKYGLKRCSCKVCCRSERHSPQSLPVAQAIVLVYSVESSIFTMGAFDIYNRQPSQP